MVKKKLLGGLGVNSSKNIRGQGVGLLRLKGKGSECPT